MNYSDIILGVIAAETTFLAGALLFRNRRRGGHYVFVDTSVLIDGRIISIAEAGFFPGTLAIPRSVVGELQFLADNGDTDKRSRARHGLDVVKELQAMKTVKTILFADSVRAEEGVDNRLLALAKRHNGALCTIDYNLNKVAQVEDIVVLNINDLAKSLRMAYLPGEKTMIELMQKGNDGHQAVGHLSDGTMVVVEGAFKLIGKTVEVEFIRSLQTSAGKMMFAKLAGASVLAAQSGPKQAKGTKPKTPAITQKASTLVARVERPQSQKQLPQQSTPKKNSYSRNQQRRRTHEDSLVELANSQD